MLTAAENKRRLQRAFARLAEGDGAPFMALLADDVRWTITGTTRWSRTYVGKRAVVEELIGPLFAQFADRYVNHASRFIAEDDWVAIECRGHVTTKAGQRYDNRYCYICRMADGQVRELTEYLDTALVERALQSPARGDVEPIRSPETGS